MFILIKDNTKIIPFIVNKNIEYKGINIYEKNGIYYIELKNSLYFFDNEKIKVLDIGKYDIKQDKRYYSINIYVYKNDDGYNDYKLYKNTNFIIANNERASIVSLDSNIKDKYLLCKNGVLQSNNDIIVNHHKYDGDVLKQGDLIEFFGIRIIYFEHFLYINNFRIINKLQTYENKGVNIKYKDFIPSDNYYIPDDICDFELDEINDYILPQKPNNMDFIKSLIPNIVMCFAMCIMAYMNYVNNLKNGDSNVFSFIIMPISMLITSVLIPIVLAIISKSDYKKECCKTKNEYIEYLNNYKDILSVNIENYTKSLNSRFFDLNENKMMFYTNNNSNEFMKISIGLISQSKHFKAKKTNDKEIDDILNQIENMANSIENCPLYVDLKENKKITVISKSIDKAYYYNLFLLETVFKHHYDDINVAIYSKNNNLFNRVYNLPHLFIYNKRLTLNCEEQLQELDQLKLNKPLILFLYDKCNYVFTNKNIYIVYFSTDMFDLYKDSNAIVNYINTNGVLYTNCRQIFKYVLRDIDFNSYFSYLGRYKYIGNKNNIYTFNNIFKDSIKDYYKNNDHSLKATFAYNNNELISLDLHETKQGPHGLIGGSTGSGKSELIVSLILSLCIKYSPEYLNIVLIDYKGGGLKDSLSYNGITIPHVVCSISNLENNALDRLIIALHNECKRRQELFKELSSKAKLSIMNLDDYLDNNLYDMEKISHLLIVVDEFAELKKENPEQIKELISISRIGRSLGIHLILATQKPAGVIDDEIWSNSRFKIALKVFDEKDSMDIIKCKDAAYLNNPGSFIMHIDGSTSRAQSIYTKNDIYGNDSFKVSTLNSQLAIDKTYKKSSINVLSSAMYYCKEIIDASKNCNVHKIDYLPPLQKRRQDLAEDNCIVLGEIDDYINSTRGLLTFELNDSLLICSSRKSEINNILNSLNEKSRHIVVIGNRKYNGAFISDSLLYDDCEDIEYLIKTLYRNRNNNLTLVIEDLSCLLSYDESYPEIFYKLIKRKDSINLSLIFITSTTQLSFKIINAFKNKILVQINDYSDLSNFYGTRSIYKGNSYYYNEKPISFVPIKIEEYKESNQSISNLIKHIPEYIEAGTINNKILIGYSEESKEPIYIQNNINIVSLDQELLNAYTSSYSNIKSYLYNYSVNIEPNLPILWLGPGIFNQRLFISGRKEDIDTNQGILINNSKTTLIRRINNV